MKSDFSEWITALSCDPFFVAIVTIIAFIVIVLLATRPKPAKSLNCVLCTSRGWHVGLESPKAKAAREKNGGFVCPPCRDKKSAKILIFSGRK